MLLRCIPWNIKGPCLYHENTSLVTSEKLHGVYTRTCYILTILYPAIEKKMQHTIRGWGVPCILIGCFFYLFSLCLQPHIPQKQMTVSSFLLPKFHATVQVFLCMCQHTWSGQALREISFPLWANNSNKNKVTTENVVIPCSIPGVLPPRHELSAGNQERIFPCARKPWKAKTIIG